MVIAGAAGLVSLATWFAMPEQFVFYGILHAIAVSSLLGLAFLRLPWGVVLGVAGGMLYLPMVWRDGAFDAPLLWWIGLSPGVPPSMDFEPLFPWFAPFLAGMALAKLMLSRGPLVRGVMPRGFAWLGFVGRHSLVNYLIHQPVMIGLFIGWMRLNG